MTKAGRTNSRTNCQQKRIAISRSTLAALPITYYTLNHQLYASPPSPSLSATYNNSIIVCRQSIAVPPSSTAAPPCSRRHRPPLLYIATDPLPLPNAPIARCRHLPVVFPAIIHHCCHRPMQLLTARCTNSYSEVYSVYIQGPPIHKNWG